MDAVSGDLSGRVGQGDASQVAGVATTAASSISEGLSSRAAVARGRCRARDLRYLRPISSAIERFILVAHPMLTSGPAVVVRFCRRRQQGIWPGLVVPRLMQ